jgi:hypothetical protein
MAGNHSRVDQRVDRIRVSDEPHDRYTQRGVPILLNTDAGNVVEKRVDAYTVHCTDCAIPAVHDENSMPICPNCGLICGGKDSKSIDRGRIVRDPKAAGRVAGTD